MRLFTLLKNIITLGNLFYELNGYKVISATAQTYDLCTMNITKPGVYLVLSNMDMSIGVTNNIMGNTITGTATSATGRYSTRGPSDAGGGLVNFRLMKFTKPGTVSLQTYNYVGKEYEVRYSLVAIRLLAGGELGLSLPELQIGGV